MPLLEVLVYLIIGLLVAGILFQIIKIAIGMFAPTANPQLINLLYAVIGLFFLIWVLNLILPAMGMGHLLISR